MKHILLLLTIFIGIEFTARAQVQHITSQTLGMGGGGVAYVDGYHSNFINPANLMLKRSNRPKRQLGLIGGIGVRLGGTLVNVPVYNDYFTDGLTIEGQVREDALNDLFGSSDASMKDVSLSLDVIPFGFSSRGANSSYSLAVRSRTLIKQEYSRGFAELVLFGLDADQFSTPRQVNLSSEVLGFTEVSIGWATQILALPDLFFAKNVKVYVGVAPKALIGVGFNKFDLNSTVEIQRGASGQANRFIHDFDYTIRAHGDLSEELQRFRQAKDGGSTQSLDDFLGDGTYAEASFGGIGFDLGGTIEMDISHLPFFGSRKTLTLGLSITDIGRVSFDDNTAIFRADNVFIFDGAPNGQEVDDFFDNLPDSLEDNIYGKFSVEETSNVRSRLPSMLNFGAHLSMGKFSTSLDYTAGFNGKGTSSKRSSVILGAEYRLFNILPVRGGVRTGGFSSTVYTAGFGLDFRFLEFTVAGAFPAKGADGNGSSVSGAWSGLVIRF